MGQTGSNQRGRCVKSVRCWGAHKKTTPNWTTWATSAFNRAVLQLLLNNFRSKKAKKRRSSPNPSKRLRWGKNECVRRGGKGKKQVLRLIRRE